MALLSAVSVLKKSAARCAMFNLDEMTAAVMRDCFKQFGIEASKLAAEESARLQREKVDACVVALDDKAGEILERVRSSASNRRVVIFGVCDSVGQAIKFSKYGINVLLERPLDRQTALRSVRSTHLLIVNEFRRYVRIPIVVKFEALCGVNAVVGTTIEVSGGGTSVRYRGKLDVGHDVQMAFDLPGQPGLKLRGTVAWIRGNESSAGIRFETGQSAQDAVKKWIDQYLELS